MVDGKAGYIVMADFALASFQKAGYAYGDQYMSYPMPGTDGVFDFLAESFTFPTGAVHDKSAKDWLLTSPRRRRRRRSASKRVRFRPAPTPIADDYPPYQQAAIASLKLDTVVPSIAHGVAANPAWTRAITAAVVKFGSDGHPEALVNALIDLAHTNLD